MNLRKYSIIKDGLSGLCAILCGVGYLISNPVLIIILFILWLVLTIGPGVYLKNKKIDVEDDLAKENKWRADACALHLLIIASALFSLYLLLRGEAVSINFGHILVFIGTLGIMESILFDLTVE